MFDTYKSCAGCPYRSATCHGPCEGYQARRAVADQERATMAAIGSTSTYLSGPEKNRRVVNAGQRAARRKERKV